MNTSPKFTLAGLIRGGFVVLLIWFVYSMAGQTGEGTLRVEIRDKATGQIVPAMVCITSLADHRWRTPPDGRVSPPFSTVRDFYFPRPWKPGDIGPVRVTNGDYKNNDIRSSVYRGTSDYPFWREPAAYFVSQPFTITLPVGKWRLAVARGVEYLPVFEEFEIKPKETQNRKIVLSRWVDMPRMGWYSGDDHVHFPRTDPEQDEFLLTWGKAEDVHVLNILRMGDVRKTYFEQHAFGLESRHREGDYMLVSGQEDPRSQLAHMIGLNIKEPVRDTSRYHLSDYMFDGVHAQGGLTGYAHMAWWRSWDPNIYVVSHKIDFFEILQFRQLGLEDYYDFLNLGFKLAASAGSDLPWGNTIGESRVYAYTGRKFSADAWFASLKEGHTFVTNGPMLLLTAGNAMPGDDLKVARNSNVRIRVRAWAPPIIGAPKKLELIAEGRVIRSIVSDNSAKKELKLDYSLRPGESQWIAARVTSYNGGMAHTSPIYVNVDGDSFANRPELGTLVDKRLKLLDQLSSRLSDPQFTRDFAPGEVNELMDRIAQARAKYKQLPF